MALIYKPNVLYMSPKNESIDITNDITFSFRFKGYKMSKAIGQLYQNNTTGNWSKLGSTFLFDVEDAPYYNNAIITKTCDDSSSVYGDISDNVNSTLGWAVTVYGMPSSQAAQRLATDEVVLSPSIRGFETGDMVATYDGNGTSNPHNYTFIDNYDSKLSLGNFNASGNDADGTDLTNTFTVTEGVYINLTTGDEIKQNISATSYYIYKVNEGAPEPVGYYIKVFATKQQALNGSGTVITTAVANKTFYVNPTTKQSNIFYVGAATGGNIVLYTSKEAALQGVSEAKVPLTEGSTYTIQVIENSPVVPFVPFYANTIYFNPDDVYGEDRGIILTLAEGTKYEYEYDGGELYTGQQITCSNINGLDTIDYIYYIRNWGDGTVSLYTTREAAMSNISTLLVMLSEGSNTIYLSEILSNTKLFKVSWTDDYEGNIPLISNWQAFLYSIEKKEDGTLEEVLIEQSDIQYTANVEYEFKHLLLSYLSGNNNTGKYIVKFILYDNNGYEYEGVLRFDVGYAVTPIEQSPVVTTLNCESAVSVDWNNIVSITGEKSGSGNINYINNYLYSGNYGARIPANTTITYNVEIPERSFPTFLFQPSSQFDGRIVYLDGDEQSVELKYDRANSVFVLVITNKLLNNVISVNVDSDVTTLNANKVYLIGYDADVNSIYIREYANSTYQW